MLKKRRLGIGWLTIGLLSLVSIFTSKSLGSTAFQPRATDLTLYYTASLSGNLDGCTCTKIRRAGLVKSALFLRRLAWQNDTVLVDAGDLLENKPGDKLRADYIFQAYRDLKYDAVGLGANELLNGVLEYQVNCPIIASNLSISFSSGSPCSKGPVILTRGHYRIGIFAVIDPKFGSSAPLSELIAKKFQITPIAETAAQMVQFLKACQVDLIILLYHGYYNNAIRLAQSVPGIDVMVLGHEERLIDLRKISRTAIVSPGEEGNRVGILELSLAGRQVTFIKNHFREFSYFKNPDDPEVRKMVDKYYATLSERLQYSTLAPLATTPSVK